MFNLASLQNIANCFSLLPNKVWKVQSVAKEAEDEKAHLDIYFFVAAVKN